MVVEVVQKSKSQHANSSQMSTSKDVFKSKSEAEHLNSWQEGILSYKAKRMWTQKVQLKEGWELEPNDTIYLTSYQQIKKPCFLLQAKSIRKDKEGHFIMMQNDLKNIFQFIGTQSHGFYRRNR